MSNTLDELLREGTRVRYREAETDGEQPQRRPRIRGFVIERTSREPLHNVPVTVWAELDEDVRLPLARLVTDRAGYVSAPLPAAPRA